MTTFIHNRCRFFNTITYKGYEWLITVGSRFEDRIYWTSLLQLQLIITVHTLNSFLITKLSLLSGTWIVSTFSKCRRTQFLVPISLAVVDVFAAVESLRPSLISTPLPVQCSQINSDLIQKSMSKWDCNWRSVGKSWCRAQFYFVGRSL
jgi:hypothetical protein